MTQVAGIIHLFIHYAWKQKSWSIGVCVCVGLRFMTNPPNLSCFIFWFCFIIIDVCHSPLLALSFLQPTLLCGLFLDCV